MKITCGWYQYKGIVIDVQAGSCKNIGSMAQKGHKHGHGLYNMVLTIVLLYY